MGPRVSPAGFSASSGGRPSFEILTDSAAAARRPARALSAGGCHDRFASCHKLRRKVTRRFGGGCYSLRRRADLRTEDSTAARRRPRSSWCRLGGLRAVLSICAASGRGSVVGHQGQWPSVGRPSDPS